MASSSTAHSYTSSPPPKISHLLTNLPLRPSSLSTLLSRGFTTTSEVDTSSRTSSRQNHWCNGSLSNFASELGCDLPTAASILREVDECISSKKERIKTVSAASLLEQNQQSLTTRPIITFSHSIDTLLGGGVPISELTELVGLPGIGKTQLGMQLAVNTLLSARFGGVEGEARNVNYLSIFFAISSTAHASLLASI